MRSLLLRFLSRIGSWLAPTPRAPQRGRALLEPLESRIAPATLINAHAVAYTDVNGYHVTVTSSLPIFTKSNYNNNTVLTFAAGTGSGTQQLEEINLASSAITSNVIGDSLSVTVQKVSGVNVLTSVGEINSIFSLGHVTVQGDLGVINAGAHLAGPVNYIGLSSLNVHTLGGEGTSTQAPSTTSTPVTLTSEIYGSAGSITILGDMNGAKDGAEINVNSNTGDSAGNGSVNSITIGGSIIGGSATMDGFIQTAGSVGSIVIGGNLQGGTGIESGALSIGGKIGAMSVDNLIGYTASGDTTGLGQNSASILTGSNFVLTAGNSNDSGIGSLTVRGNIVGGDGAGSAEISEMNTTGGLIGAIKILGSVKGGLGSNSGELSANEFGSISIGQGLIGGSGTSAGSIDTAGHITSLTILGGGITGGLGVDTGSVITQGALGTALIHGDITGNPAAGASVTGTGQVQASSIGSFTLYGSLVGSTASETGSLIVTNGTIGTVSLHQSGASTGSLLGGSGATSGDISASTIGNVSIAGEIMGSTAASSGAILSTGAIGNVSIVNGDMIGGAGTSSGEISAGTTIHSVFIAGSVAGSGTDSGDIIAGGTIGSVKIGHQLMGGAGVGSGVVITGSGTSYGANLGALTVGGGITGGAGDNSGEIEIGGGIGSIHLNGSSLTGGAGTDSGSIYATDSVGPVSIGAIILNTGSGSGSGELSTGGDLVSLALTGGASATSLSGVVDVAGAAGIISVRGNVVGTTDSTGVFLIGGGLESISVSGALMGGSGNFTGAIFAGLDGTSGIGHVSVGSITGGSGTESGQINSGSTITSVIVNGSVQGMSGTGSGSIVSSSFGGIPGNIGSITITGSLIGNTGVNSGQISVAGNLNVLSIGGSVTGNVANGSGAILAGADMSSAGNINVLKIAGALTGADISTGTVAGSGYIAAGHIGSAIIGSIHAGSVASGATATDDGAILVANDIGSLSVTGVGGIAGTASNSVEISAYGQANPGKTDLAFGKISVAHNVEYTNFLAGYDQSLTPQNGAASIGAVSVGGNWQASNLIAGAQPVTVGGNYGMAQLIPSSSLVPTIASIIVKGQVESAQPEGGLDTYGFISGKIGAISFDGAKFLVGPKTAEPVGTTDADVEELS